MQKKLPIFYSALMLTGVNLLLRLVSTSFQVYLSGRIGAAGIGLLQLVLSVGGLSMTAAIAGIRTATMYLTAEEIGKGRPGGVKWVLSGCFRYSILCSCVVGGLLYTFAPVLAESWIGSADTVGAIRLVAGFLPVNCLCGVMVGYFTAANRIGTLAIIEIGEQAISMGSTMLLLAFWAGSKASKACEAVVLGGGISACFTLTCLVVLRLKEHPPKERKIPVAKRLFNVALPLALGDDLKAGISTAENLMVPKRLALYPLTQNPLAAFGVVCGMVFPVLMFPAAILFGLIELLIPELARCSAAGSQVRVRYLVKRSLRTALLYSCLFAGLMYLLAEPVCMALYDNSDAGILLKRFSFLIPMLYCDAITDASIKGLGDQKFCVQYNILTSAMDVVFLFVLLPKYGMGGYFFSFVVTHLINFILSLRRLIKIVGNCLSFRIPLCALLAMGLSILGAGLLPDTAGQVVVFLLLLGSLLVLFQVLGKEDLSWLQGLISSKKRPA